jgi:hypothetical protein
MCGVTAVSQRCDCSVRGLSFRGHSATPLPIVCVASGQSHLTQCVWQRAVTMGQFECDASGCAVPYMLDTAL